MGFVIWFSLITACLWGAYLWGYHTGVMEQEAQQTELLRTWPLYSAPRRGNPGLLVKMLSFLALIVVVMIIFYMYA